MDMNKIPNKFELAAWERAMKEAGLWPEKIQIRNISKPKIKARKTGAFASTVAIRPMSDNQGREVKDIVSTNKPTITKWQ